MTTCLIVQHLEPEGPYTIASALEAQGVQLDRRRVYAGEPLPPDLSGHDAIVVMGGSMSAGSDEGFPTRQTEIALLADALSRQTPALGVCLGAQLMAAASGGRVTVGPAGPEVGWAPVSLSVEAATDPLLAGLPAEMDVLHWHWDTFEPGPGAVVLASSSRYRHQAVRFGPRAWAFQFHLEIDPVAVEAFVGAFGADADQAGSSSAAILADAPGALARLAPHRRSVLNRFATLAAQHTDQPLAGHH